MEKTYRNLNKTYLAGVFGRAYPGILSDTDTPAGDRSRDLTPKKERRRRDRDLIRKNGSNGAESRREDPLGNAMQRNGGKTRTYFAEKPPPDREAAFALRA